MQSQNQMLTTFMQNKKVLVVGGSRGIGAGVVDNFQSLGAKVYYFSRNERQNIENDNKNEAIHISVDLHSADSISKGFKYYDNNENSLDILVNVAGINYCKNHNEITSDEFDEVLTVNLKSFFLTCKYSVERMSKGGKIVNVSSIAGRNKSIVSGVHYTSSKAAIIGLTRQFAHETGPLGININCVCPSQTETNMLKESMTAKEKKKLERNIPLRRLATVEDVVNPIIFLCSEESSYIHGACIDINGGQL